MAPGWQDLRALRATPPAFAADDASRRDTFNAALRQAEELADAAAVAGYAAKPLPTFYALSQAGRALAAALLAEGWRLKGHGLSSITGAADVLTSRVRPNPSSASDESTGSFQGVGAAVGSPTLAGACELGALWSANPDLADVAIPDADSSWPRAIRIALGFRRAVPAAPLSFVQDPRATLTSTGGWVSVSVNVAGNSAREVSEALTPYPTLRRARPYGVVFGGSGPVEPDEPVVRFADPAGVDRVNVGLPVDAQVLLAEYYERQDEFCSVIESTDSWPPEDIGFALPELAGGPAPHPLMLWWALLLGLSSFARYEPAAWTAAIDPSSSPLAVALERVLDLAAERVPARVLAALRAA